MDWFTDATELPKFIAGVVPRPSSVHGSYKQGICSGLYILHTNMFLIRQNYAQITYLLILGFFSQTNF